MRTNRGSRKFRSAWAALVALSTAAVTLLGVQPAAAAGTFAEADARGFRMHIDAETTTGGKTTFEEYGDIIRNVEASGAVSKVTPLDVAQSRQHTGRALCHSTGLNGVFKYNGFCWDEGDDNTSAYDPAGGWHPQGLTASHDAYAGGTVDGHHLYVASWYYGHGKSADPDVDRDKLARISVVESTGSSRTYGHVMLVQPSPHYGNAQFEPVTRVHADGVVWYGNKLFVANGGELQVYDFEHMWKMGTTSVDRTGIVDGVSSARHHQWALPMVGRYLIGTSADHPRACPGERACLSSLSLDRSGTTDHLVSGEYLGLGDGRTANVIRWPLDGATGLPRSDSSGTVTAAAAYAAPVDQLQGVATDGRHYYLSAQCPTGYMGDPDTRDGYSCIYEALPGHAPTVLTRSPSLTQNLSYSPSSGRLWGTNELTGKRVIFSLLPRNADGTVYLSNEYSKLCAGGGNKIDNGDPVIQWGCTNARDERWLFEETKDSNGNLAYFVQNEYSGKCMGVASSLADGAGVIQYTCSGAVDEKWWYDSATHELRNVYSGKCLGLGSAATKGTQLIQWPCNGAQDEKWTRIPR
ncbi:RICIN domain-containing protein [Streptomyces sp. NPDC015032]|uniref:RICIN domain-containing protein n=1 Tax=Streptomyces sp. NPDC015032 TaxID=3364937 RepID=UPI003700C668